MFSHCFICTVPRRHLHHFYLYSSLCSTSFFHVGYYDVLWYSFSSFLRVSLSFLDYSFHQIWKIFQIFLLLSSTKNLGMCILDHLTLPFGFADTFNSFSLFHFLIMSIAVSSKSLIFSSTVSSLSLIPSNVFCLFYHRCCSFTSRDSIQVFKILSMSTLNSEANGIHL